MAYRRKGKKSRRRLKLSSQYTYHPYTNGDCINPLCGSRRVGKCHMMRWGDGHKEDSLACHDCALELPESVWNEERLSDTSIKKLTQHQRVNRQIQLKRLERTLKSTRPEDEGSEGRLRVNRWRRASGMSPLPEGEGTMAKKSAKKSAGKKAPKKDKAAVAREKAGVPRTVNLYVPNRHVDTAKKLLATAKKRNTGYTELAWSLIAKGLK